jgi:glycosyltransferase involved in cell wall biosynthesis
VHILILPSKHLLTEKAPLAGVFQVEQARALARAGHQVGIISAGVITLRYLFSGYPYERQEQFENFHISRRYERTFVPARYYPHKAFQKKVSRLFFTEFDTYVNKYGRPDVVHAHNFLHAGFVAAELKDKYGIPFVLTEHSSSFARGGVPDGLNSDLRTVCKKATYVNCVSFAFKRLLDQRLGVNFEVFHNIVDGIFFEKQRTEKKEDYFRFLNVASLDDNKNQALALKAFSKKFKNQKYRLTFIGDGPLESKLKNLSKQLGIADQVEFLGRLPRVSVRDEMMKAQCFILPSTFETFGVVLIEALACGIPLIATKCGGPEDIVNTGNGILIDIESEDQLAAAMEKIVKTHANFTPEQLRAEAQSKYGEKAFVDRAMSIYQKAIQGRA